MSASLNFLFEVDLKGRSWGRLFDGAGLLDLAPAPTGSLSDVFHSSPSLWRAPSVSSAPRPRNWKFSTMTEILDRLPPPFLSSQVSYLRRPSTKRPRPFWTYWLIVSA